MLLAALFLHPPLIGEYAPAFFMHTKQQLGPAVGPISC